MGGGHDADELKKNKSRVIKIDSEKSWDFFLTLATNGRFPVVVHFTAFWCIPSVAMNPFFEQLAMTYKDVLFLSVDVDEIKGVAAKMEVRAMPTFVMMKGGNEVDKLLGANPEEMGKRIDGFVHSIRACNNNNKST